MPTPLPDIRKVRLVLELHEAGKNFGEIERETGVPHRHARYWMNNLRRLSPVIDEIALERALDGDRAVYKNLTAYEKLEFWKQNAAITAATELELRTNDNGGVWFNPRVDYIADCLGLSRETVQSYNTKAKG